MTQGVLLQETVAARSFWYAEGETVRGETMTQYTGEELAEALRAVTSIIHKCEKAQEKFPEGTSQHTLLKNRLKAMYIAKTLMEDALHRAQ